MRGPGRYVQVLVTGAWLSACTGRALEFTSTRGGASATGGGSSTIAAGGTTEISSNGGSPTTAPAGGTSGSSVTGECPTATMPNEPTLPGYPQARDPGVAAVLSSMSPDNKIQQMYGVPDPQTRDSSAYQDIERSQDVTVGNDILGVRGFKYRDGSRGVNLVAGQPDRRSQGNDFSTAFPAESVRAASWDVELEMQVGEAIGDETMVSNNNVLFAPCINILRHPYWGRSQDTYGEDMYQLGRMASAFVAGVQQHVVACAKHLAANNIEYNRSSQNALIDEQTLREVYTRHFDRVVNQGGVGCVMAAYNSINGTKSTQNAHLLTDILKAPRSSGGIGFRGFVASDLWAMPGDQSVPAVTAAQVQTLQALEAGLDIELPWDLHYSQLGALLANAQTQSVAATQIDAAAGRILEQKFRFGTVYTDQAYGLGTPTTTRTDDSISNNDSHLALAEEAEIRAAVLLSNGTGGLPVLPITNVTSIAVVGLDIQMSLVENLTTYPVSGQVLHLATDVNLGDRGSSRVNADPNKSIGPSGGILAAANSHNIMNVVTGNTVNTARGADFIVVVVGLTAGDEGEEYTLASSGDRTSLELPGGQADFVNQVLALKQPTAIIIESGSIVNVPWLSHANQQQATIWAGYGGQRAGAAYGKLLFGDRNFSGKLPVSWPQESDLPQFRDTDGTNNTKMGYFVGYRDYDNRAATGNPVNLVFPFGHGLSYTAFAYTNLQVPCLSVAKNNVVSITTDVTNTGSYDGDEVVMMFVAGPPNPAGITGKRPVKELKGFQRVSLQAGATAQVTMPLNVNELRHWEGDDATGSWVIDSGDYTIMVGPNAADLPLRGKFTVHD